MKITRHHTASQHLKPLRFCAVAGVALLASTHAHAQIVAPPPSVEVNLQALERLRAANPAPQPRAPQAPAAQSPYSGQSSSQSSGSLGTLRSNGSADAVRQPINAPRYDNAPAQTNTQSPLLLRPLGTTEDILNGKSSSSDATKKYKPKKRKPVATAPSKPKAAAPVVAAPVVPAPAEPGTLPEPSTSIPVLPPTPEPVPMAPTAPEKPAAELPPLPAPVAPPAPPAAPEPAPVVPAPDVVPMAPADLPPPMPMPDAAPPAGEMPAPLPPVPGEIPAVNQPVTDGTMPLPMDPGAPVPPPGMEPGAEMAPPPPPPSDEMPAAAPMPPSDEMAPPPPPMAKEESFIDSILETISDIWDSIMETIQGWLGNAPARPAAPAVPGPDDLPPPAAPGPDDMPAPAAPGPDDLPPPVPGAEPMPAPELGPDGLPLPGVPVPPPAGEASGEMLPPPEGALPPSPDLMPPPGDVKTENPVPLPVPALKPAHAPTPPGEVPATNMKTPVIKAEPKTVKVDNKTQASVPVPNVGGTELPPLPDMMPTPDAGAPAPALGDLPSLPALPEAVPDKAAGAAALPAIAAPVDSPAPTLSDQLEVVEQKGAAATSEGGSATAQIAFTADEKQVPAAGQTQLQSIAETLKKDTAKRVRVVAYASGTKDQASAARRISLARALATRAALIDLGVDSLRINVQAKGNEGQNADRADVFVE